MVTSHVGEKVNQLTGLVSQFVQTSETEKQELASENTGIDSEENRNIETSTSAKVSY